MTLIARLIAVGALASLAACGAAGRGPELRVEGEAIVGVAGGV